MGVKITKRGIAKKVELLLRDWDIVNNRRPQYHDGDKIVDIILNYITKKIKEDGKFAIPGSGTLFVTTNATRKPLAGIFYNGKLVGWQPVKKRRWLEVRFRPAVKILKALEDKEPENEQVS